MAEKQRESKGSVKLPPMKKKDNDDDERSGTPKEKFVAKNWSFFSKNKDKKMSTYQKSRWLMYEDTTKDVAESQAVVKKRLLDKKKAHDRQNAPTPVEVHAEKDKHAKLIGQLKAAEARNRLRIMRLRYQANKAQEINHLISCQSSALKAVRLQALVPPHQDFYDPGDVLDKLERSRVEGLLEDPTGRLINRIQ